MRPVVNSAFEHQAAAPDRLSAQAGTVPPGSAPARSGQPSAVDDVETDSDQDGAPGSVRVATDVGGTFTDLVCLYTDPVAGSQQLVTAKSDTTPPRFERGVMDVLQKSGRPPSDISLLAHGTTVVINALTERTGARTGLITTQGFRDSLEIARGNRPDFFNLGYVKPTPFVPRDRRREIPGRISHNGAERAPLDLSVLPAILDDFRADGVEALAVCLLHAYANPAHERAVLARIQELWPEVPTVASHQITRQWREYERTSTTVLSAYVQPLAASYLRDLSDALQERRFAGQLYVVQSNGGVQSARRASEIPITMVESGPACGVFGAAELGRLIGEPNVLALDIGGTTAKCSLIVDGQVPITTDYWIQRSRKSAGYPILAPVVDLVEIGAGGGSIATVDDLGKLRVGPESAGAVPGPVAYGRGGTEATTTDANLALGRINADYFCGGEIVADMRAVGGALDGLAQRLGTDRDAVARGIIRIANDNMISALKLISVNRGYDPRDFTLVAFGGAGGLHAVALAAELGIGRIVVPRAADVFSAWGVLMTDLRRDFFLTRIGPMRSDHAQAIDGIFEEVAAEARSHFALEGIKGEDVRIARYGSMRYSNQEHTLEVPFPDGRLDERAVEQIVQTFHTNYEQHYTYRLQTSVELVEAHVVATVEVAKLEPVPVPSTGRLVQEACKGRRQVDYADDGIHLAEIYDGDLLEAGMDFCGPAIVETSGTTIVVHPGNGVSIDDYGNLHLRFSELT
jgi:N-methylhydantoinase A